LNDLDEEEGPTHTYRCPD